VVLPELAGLQEMLELPADLVMLATPGLMVLEAQEEQRVMLVLLVTLVMLDLLVTLAMQATMDLPGLAEQRVMPVLQVMPATLDLQETLELAALAAPVRVVVQRVGPVVQAVELVLKSLKETLPQAWMGVARVARVESAVSLATRPNSYTAKQEHLEQQDLMVILEAPVILVLSVT